MAKRKSKQPAWAIGKKSRGRRKPQLRKSTNIFQTGGRHNDRRLHNEAVSAIFFKLGDDAWAPKHGSLQPILREVSQQRNIPCATLRYWYNHFLLYGETIPETDLWEKKGFIRKEETRAAKWKRQHTKVLKEIIGKQPWLFLDEIRERLLAAAGTLWSPKHIWQKMKENDLTLQVVTYNAKQQDRELREGYKATLDEKLINPEQLLFLDETAKDRSASRRRRFWNQRGETPTAYAHFEGSHGKRYSMIAACDIDGFILETCHVVERDGPEKRTVDTEVFTHWLYDNVCPLLGSYAEGEPRSIVVLDNASIHHSDEIVELIQETGAIVLYLAPYSPDMNPIELMFGQYKQGLKRYNDMDWWTAHMKSLSSVTPTNARNYFRKCGVPFISVEDSLDEEEELVVAVAVSVVVLSFLGMI